MKGPNVDLLKVAPPVLNVDSVGDMEVVDLAVQGELQHLQRLGSSLLGRSTFCWYPSFSISKCKTDFGQS